MESARCPCAPNMDRDTMFEFIRSRDPANHLTNNVLEWNGSKKQTLATDWAWNGQAFECVYFCHKTFNTLDGLNQHLMSPIRKCLLCTGANLASLLALSCTYQLRDGDVDRLDADFLHCETQTSSPFTTAPTVGAAGSSKCSEPSSTTSRASAAVLCVSTASSAVSRI